MIEELERRAIPVPPETGTPRTQEGVALPQSARVLNALIRRRLSVSLQERVWFLGVRRGVPELMSTAYDLLSPAAKRCCWWCHVRRWWDLQSSLSG